MKIYIFECPLHGWEMNVFCFRAFAGENLALWKVIEVYKPRDLGIEERKELGVRLAK